MSPSLGITVLTKRKWAGFFWFQTLKRDSYCINTNEIPGVRSGIEIIFDISVQPSNILY